MSTTPSPYADDALETTTTVAADVELPNTGCVPRVTTQTEDTVIIFTDGAYDCETDAGGAGYLLRSNRGEDICKVQYPLPGAHSNMDAEIASARSALSHALALGPSYVVFYTDCQRLINGIENPHGMYEDDYLWFKEQLDMLDVYSLKHIPSSRNEIADGLASRGMEYDR